MPDTPTNRSHPAGTAPRDPAGGSAGPTRDRPTDSKSKHGGPESRGRAWRWFALSALALLSLLWLGYLALPWFLPLPAELENAAHPAPPASGVTPQPLSTPRPPASNVPTSAAQPVTVTPYAELPKPFVQLLVVSQDPGFWQHSGTDSSRVAGALADGIRRGRLQSGASTITEQLAKLTSGRTSGRTIGSRLADSLTARRIEISLTKEQILENYSARLPFGNGFTGLTEAAAGYFGKTPTELSLAECALLAALPDAPSRLNPYRHFDEAKAAQLRLLRALTGTGEISPETAKQAAESPINLHPSVAK